MPVFLAASAAPQLTASHQLGVTTALQYRSEVTHSIEVAQREANNLWTSIESKAADNRALRQEVQDLQAARDAAHISLMERQVGSANDRVLYQGAGRPCGMLLISAAHNARWVLGDDRAVRGGAVVVLHQSKHVVRDARQPLGVQDQDGQFSGGFCASGQAGCAHYGPHYTHAAPDKCGRVPA